MAGGVTEDDRRPVRDRLGAIVWGREDPRVRATYRVLLAFPVLWILVGTVSVLVAGLVLPPEPPKGLLMSVGGTLQATFVAGALVVWARYLDRRPLSDYGTVLERSWAVDAVVGFAAVLAGSAVWLGVGSAMGWATFEVAPGTPNGSLVLALLGVFVGVAVNVWVQETVFWGVALKDGAEGLANRGVDPSRAVLAAWLVGIVLYTAMHGPSEAGRVVNLLVVLGVYGLLYVHTGNLALSIGVHTGVNYAGQTILGDPAYAASQPTIAEASTTLGGVLGTLSGGAVPNVLLAYLLLLGWIRWRQGEIGIVTALAEWTPR
jgi:membrane protease YdiL (CAAX protease family)